MMLTQQVSGLPTEGGDGFGLRRLTGRIGSISAFSLVATNKSASQPSWSPIRLPTLRHPEKAAGRSRRARSPRSRTALT
jgi:hypothetical protein